MWKRKGNGERLPWYRASDYKGNLTEDQKRQLDAFRMQPKHPAASYDDLPEEVQNYINGIELELYDHKQGGAASRAFFWSAIGAALLFANYKGWFGAPTIWSWLTSGIALAAPWLWYRYEWNKNAEELFPKDDSGNPISRTDEEIRKEWELNYLSEHRGPNDKRHIDRLKSNAETINRMLFGNLSDKRATAFLCASVGTQIRRQLESRFGTEAAHAFSMDTDHDLQQQAGFLDGLPVERLSQLADALHELGDRELSEDAPPAEEAKETSQGMALFILSQWVKSKAILRSATDTKFIKEVHDLEEFFYDHIKKLLRMCRDEALSS
jgi:hypothetical protein